MLLDGWVLAKLRDTVKISSGLFVSDRASLENKCVLTMCTKNDSVFDDFR